ncbi:MAG: patatin-like phospholipase family protein, partial [Bacteroidia bacterium]
SHRHVEEDSLRTIAMLDRWRSRYINNYGEVPRAVMVCSSGGGLRSALWTTLVLQQLDSISGGEFTQSMRLISGASGGMIGAAYFRELSLRKELGDSISLYSPVYQKRITSDLLNRVAFRLFTDAIVPNRSISIDDKQYDYERGIAFDRQLQINLPELAGRKLGHYAEAEAQGILPVMVLTPSVLNQGIKLYISSSPVAFLAGRKNITANFPSKAFGVEFRRMFRDHQADSLSIASALRMNATFPFVLPVVELPSSPPMMVIDAGAVDNYGVQTAVSYLYTFREWFAQTTKGVALVQIRDNSRQDPIEDLSRSGFMARSLAPLGGGYSAIVKAKDTGNDLLLESVTDWFDGNFDVVSFEYPQETSDRPATISLHLTQREKKSILRSIYTTHNERSFQELGAMFLSNLAVQK